LKKKNKQRHKHNQKRGRNKKRQPVKKLMSPEMKVKTTDDTIDFAVVKGKERKIARVPMGFIFAFRRSGHTKCNGSGRFLIKSKEKNYHQYLSVCFIQGGEIRPEGWYCGI